MTQTDTATAVEHEGFDSAAFDARMEAAEFNAALDEFFDLAFAKAERGEMSYDQVERFLDIIDRENRQIGS